MEPGGRRIRTARGALVVDAIRQAGVDMETPCDGRGRCYRCAIEASGALSPLSEIEEEARRLGLMGAGQRLACQVRSVGPTKIRVPEFALTGIAQIMADGTQIGHYSFEPNVRRVLLRLVPPSVSDDVADRERLERALADAGIRARCTLPILANLGQKLRGLQFHCAALLVGEEIIDIEAPDAAPVCGIAFDIGTTTVVAYLLDLLTGHELAVVSALNPQSRFGSDVISRITFAAEQSEGLRVLARTVRTLMNDLIKKACTKAKVGAQRIYEVSVVGNAAMQHLLLAIDPRSLALAPYVPTTTGSLNLRAASLGLNVHPNGGLFILPGLGGFVGADTMGVILATRFHVGQGAALAIDIGTNTEIVGREPDSGRLIALSTPAGPAFEGGRITSGCRGMIGAIQRVRLIDGKVGVETIGNANPVGICGSGLIDALAVMRQLGLLAASGRVLQGAEFLLVKEDRQQRKLGVTQKDVRELQLAKAAIATGIKMVLNEIGIAEKDLREILLAGAFGNFIDRANAQSIGLLPGIAIEKVRQVGNAAGQGAKLALVSKAARVEAEKVAREVRVLNLAQQAKFQDVFLESMAFN
ncbi:MAG: hypothetical protein A3G24_22650 [Betaproteobacteria bacterium RIFCSPLOWO2_12_FULL_62_13]|nr:MAG: hypothetical protein A3G24_22650 [Betaproteobacteria bacterium RIFCSPLOWO2_12_FULL_62_13]